MSFRRAARAAIAGGSRRSWILVAAAFILAGLSASCGSSSSHSSASHNAYVSLPQKGNVALVHLNDSTGVLTLGGETPPVLGTSPTGLALSSNKKFLYASNVAAGANSVSIFNVASDGSLTQTGDATPVGSGPQALAIDPTGKYLLIANSFDLNVSVFSLDSGTGAISLIGNSFIGVAPTDLKISGSFVYVSVPDAGLIIGFTLNSDGTLSPIAGSPFITGGGVSGLAIDPGNHFLYSANTSAGTVSVFAINAGGTLSQILGSPYTVGKAPRAIAIDPFGSFLYVANQLSNNVSAFTITAGAGTLTAITGSPFAAGTGPLFALVEPAGKFLYVGNQGSTNVSVYSYDSTTGVLKAVTGSPFTVGSAPGAMVITH